jgi:hypothetical protein
VPPIIALLTGIFVGAVLRGRPFVDFKNYLDSATGGHGGPPLQLILKDVSQTNDDATVTTVRAPLVEEV